MVKRRAVPLLFDLLAIVVITGGKKPGKYREG
jgi:hypothetical protein